MAEGLITPCQALLYFSFSMSSILSDGFLRVWIDTLESTHKTGFTFYGNIHAATWIVNVRHLNISDSCVVEPTENVYI
jgi:hypothetical protein